MGESLSGKIKESLIGLAILIGLGLLWLFLFAIWMAVPAGSFAAEIAGAVFLLYSIALLVFFAFALFKGGGEGILGGIGLLVIAGLLCFFLVHLWKGLLIVLLFAGIGIAIWIERFWLEKRRGEEFAEKLWELEDQLKELKEQLDKGAITEEEYEQKKKLLEKYQAT